MPSLTNSDGEEDVALALKLSKLSPDEFDEQLAQFRPGDRCRGPLHAHQPVMRRTVWPWL